MQSLGAGLRLFNYPKAAAVDLILWTHFTALAQAQNQPGVCLLVFGTTLAAAKAVTQFLRSAPVFLTQTPKVVWITQEQAALLRLLSLNYAPLAELLGPKADQAALRWALELDVIETTPSRAPYDPDVLHQAVALAARPPTAVIVAEEEATLAKSNIQIAIALREASQRLCAFAVPIFVFLPSKGAKDQFFRCRVHTAENAPASQKKMPRAAALAEVIEPFGRSDEVWTCHCLMPLL